MTLHLRWFYLAGDPSFERTWCEKTFDTNYENATWLVPAVTCKLCLEQIIKLGDIAVKRYAELEQESGEVESRLSNKQPREPESSVKLACFACEGYGIEEFSGEPCEVCQETKKAAPSKAMRICPICEGNGDIEYGDPGNPKARMCWECRGLGAVL